VKAGDLLGRKVLVRQGGEEVGSVKDLVVDRMGRRVLGFVISEGLLKGTRVARWAALQAIGPDSVILGNPADVVKTADAPEIKDILDEDLSIRGLRLQTTEGKDLGKVEDFDFDEETGEVRGFELSGGMFAGTFGGGRSFLPSPATVELGKDVAFVSPEAETTIRKS